MEIKVRNIPEKLGGIAKDKKSIVGFCKDLVGIISASIDYSDFRAIVPVTFSHVIENVGERSLVLGNGDVIGEEPIVISLTSKYGEPFVDKTKRDEMVRGLTDELKDRFGKEVAVEIEFTNEIGLFVYLDGRAIN